MNKKSLKVKESGYALITKPLLNKGMAFSEKERDIFQLHGILPPQISTMQEQCARSYLAFKSKPSDIEKYIYLCDLQNSNETLFYHVLIHHLEEMLPIIYTPVVGDGCVRFSQIYRRPRGLFLSYPNRHRLDEILSNPHFDEVKVIVVSDGERILGLGDQGAGGIGIPIGKLALYTALAGISPKATLPILLDVGTDNEERLQSSSYIGWHNRRIRGKEYDDFLDLFIKAVKKRFPNILLQWEDFAKDNAYKLLERYKNDICSFNDDIQGTAAVALGTLLAAIHVSGIPLSKQRILMVGDGSAGCGISHLLKKALEQEGLSESETKNCIYLVGPKGLLTEDQIDLLPFQKEIAQPKGHPLKGKNLKELVESIHPTLLVGVSSNPGFFTEDVIKEMAKHVERPIIFPLSNPTSKSEATPENLMLWTNGKAIIGTGSPFPPLIKEGKPFKVDQTNNAYIFPGLGLGIIAAKATKVTESMFMAAAKVLADASPAKLNSRNNLLPPLEKARDLSFQIALAVAKEAISSGVAPANENVEFTIKEAIWDPVYIPYEKE